MPNSPLPVLPSPAMLALPVALIYAAFAVAWIVYSDQVIGIWVRDPDRLTDVQTLKGIVFVVGTALMLWAMVRRGYARQAELQEVLLRREARLRIALRATGLGLWDYLVESREVEYDEEAARMLGRPPAAFREPAEVWLGRLHPDDREPFRQRFRDYLEGRSEQYASEFRLAMPNGEFRWFSSVGQIVDRDAQGLPLRLIGTYLDITGRRRSSGSNGVLSVEHTT
ncbi:PAS domain-containing protein [Azoarcus olearius]|uniref:histidine kinase n=1 Tax=Azoarcus sp. (strain BH72) TaxID=418699 RepID=A1K336_AZOSB|nr:PAS domain-containing protein [Azoarcus olearius]ANQ83768.1 PAS/PAC domain-containing protein [Azoarcus olearius]CAL93241.1 PAS/PAC-domain containing protein [Azoarcus olearius]